MKIIYCARTYYFPKNSRKSMSNNQARTLTKSLPPLEGLDREKQPTGPSLSWVTCNLRERQRAHKLQGGTIREFETLEWRDSGTELSNENVGPRVGLRLLL